MSFAASSPTGQSSGPVVPVLGPLHRDHQPGAWCRRNRHDSVYKLELAFSKLPRRRRYAQPWLVDRQLRHFLVVYPATPHRTEFCIDKLYSPDRRRADGAGCGAPGVRDAAARADEPCAAAATGAGRRFWREPYTTALHALGHGAGNSVHAAALHLAGPRRRHRRTAAGRVSVRRAVARAAFRVPRFPVAGETASRSVALRSVRRSNRAGTCSARRHARRNGALRRLPSASSGCRSGPRRLQGMGLTSPAATHRRDLQRARGAAPPDGDQRRGSGRRALSRLAAALVPASGHHSGPRAAHVRHRRHVDGSFGLGGPGPTCRIRAA